MSAVLSFYQFYPRDGGKGLAGAGLTVAQAA